MTFQVIKDPVWLLPRCILVEFQKLFSLDHTVLIAVVSIEEPDYPIIFFLDQFICRT